MALSDVPSRSRIFIDANIFIYHFTGRSEECRAFLVRVENGDLRGFVGQTTLLEVAHRLMIAEAMENQFGRGTNPAARLSRRPELVRELSKYYFATMKVPQMGVEILSLPRDFLPASQEYRQRHGLLVNDSLVSVYMQHVGVSLLASADAAFDRLPGVRRFGPSDI
ncbi:MAG: type II toxin-antitoxin system VapC family toxin [Armatimonadetes bacterium]|nr:type II toxin-antitoxin system VapC family toxin [Armatimonadota bacterium]